MDKETLQAFSTRVTQANRSELVVITYEIILEEIRCAREAFDAGEISRYSEGLLRAGKFINELMGSLDYRFEVSGNLMALYSFSNRQLVLASAEKRPERLEAVSDILRRLLEGFREVSRQDESGPVMVNTQKLFTGLTYGRGKLNETFVSVNEAGRGFRA